MKRPDCLTAPPENKSNDEVTPQITSSCSVKRPDPSLPLLGSSLWHQLPTVNSCGMIDQTLCSSRCRESELIALYLQFLANSAFRVPCRLNQGESLSAFSQKFYSPYLKMRQLRNFISNLIVVVHLCPTLQPHELQYTNVPDQFVHEAINHKLAGQEGNIVQGVSHKLELNRPGSYSAPPLIAKKL